MNGVLAKALLALVAKYVEQHGAELFDKLIALILSKINPAAVVASAASCDDCPDCIIEFSSEADAIIAEHKNAA